MAIIAEHEKATASRIGNGERLTRKDLQEIVENHGVWLDSNGEAGIRADFSGKNLEYADLVDTRLPDAFLHKTNLKGADLTLADLRGATLVQANLAEATLAWDAAPASQSSGRRHARRDGTSQPATCRNKPVRRHPS